LEKSADFSNLLFHGKKHWILLILEKQSRQTGQNPKIRATAHFNEIKTYKTAKKFFLFL